MTPTQPIPGTTLFDGEQAQKGYALNRMCFSFNSADNRAAFKADEEGYMRQYGFCRVDGQATCSSMLSTLTEKV